MANKFSLVVGLIVFVQFSSSQVTVATAQYNNARSGENTAETIITPSNVKTLVETGRNPLDGPVFGQPLYIPGKTIGGNVHDVLIVATMANTVYALDANSPGAAPLWSTNFGLPWSTYTAGGQYYGLPLGILSTPVVDPTNNLVYVVSVSNTPVYTLRKINLLTGSQIASVNISGSVSGTGNGSSAGTLAFNPSLQGQHINLTLANSNIYIGFGSLIENNNWHGWLFAYAAADLSQVAVFCTTPNGGGGGVWSSGGGIVVDGSGNLYFLTGNGDWDGSANFSQTVLKLSPSLSLLDWFTPSNESSTSAVDADVASGRLMLVPGTKYLIFGSKDGRAWVIDSTSMGHLQGTGTAPQVFTIVSLTATSSSGVYGGTFFGSVGYFPIANGSTYAYQFSSSTFNATPIATTALSFSQVMSAGSSNSGSNAILWAITISSSAFTTTQPLVLRAFDPATLAELWNSGTSVGNVSKFSSPTIANGRVYVATHDGYIVTFGLPSATAATTVTGFPKSSP